MNKLALTIRVSAKIVENGRASSVSVIVPMLPATSTTSTALDHWRATAAEAIITANRNYISRTDTWMDVAAERPDTSGPFTGC